MPRIPKPRRQANKKLMLEMRGKPCVVCEESYKQTTGSHIVTRKRGGPDAHFNLVPMCQLCHIKWGQYGPTKFFKQHPKFETLLYKMGWTFDGFKLWHPNLFGHV